MLILDPVLRDFDIGAKIQSSLSERKIDFFVFDDIPSAPDTKCVQQALVAGKPLETMCGLRPVPRSSRRS